MRRAILTAAVGLLCGSLAAEVTFGGLDLSANHRLLFSAVAEAPGLGAYTTLFLADLSAVDPALGRATATPGGDLIRGARLQQLTFYPEVLTYLPQLGAIQVQNRFGLFRGSASGEFEPVPGFAGFVDGAPVAGGRVLPVTASPDGRYLVVLEPVSAAHGDLVLVAPDGTGRTVVAEQVELSTTLPSARWSPDSQFFVYARAGRLYYYSISQHERGRLLGESYRILGEGSMASVRWATDSSLYYVRGSLVYRIIGAEFFARSLYAGLLQVGTIVGKLPFPFDPNFDAFWIAPDGTAVLLNKGGRNVFVLFLNADDFVDEGQVLSLPSLFLPRNMQISNVLWSEAGDVTLLAVAVGDRAASSALFRLRVTEGAETMVFSRTDDRDIRAIALSPDERRVALLSSSEVAFRDHASWQLERSVALDGPIRAVWMDAQRLLVGAASTIEIVEPAGGGRTLVALSQVTDHSISDAGRVLVSVGSRHFELGTAWRPTADRPDGRREVANTRFRVYLENLSSGSYRNTVMVRRVDGIGTSLLFPPPVTAWEPFPAADEPVDFRHFTHGSRIRRREVAFAINAVDSVEGLTEILGTLAGYGVRATFFVNGEFIRRHPAALKEIIRGGHEVGSLFFAYFDMTDRRYQVTEEFITAGLSRNEDDYFEATGSELSLLWHAPYYTVSDLIVEAGQRANYLYVGRDVDSLDWVPRRTDEGLSALYMPSARLVERVLELKKPGSIISMQVGTPDEARGGREDYLFQRLDMLLNGLLNLGYRVVPVSTLIENAR